LTAASGLTRNFSELFAVRLGVGSGEAVCAPASASLIGDLFPASRRAKALSVFMIGLPVGIALSFLGSSLLEHRYGWRFTFYVAGLPGLICAGLALLIWEPARGAAEAHKIHASAKRAGSPYLLVLSIPTMWWIIASGAFHNFNMYAIGAFLSPFLQRFHHLSKLNAGMISMVVYGLAGVPGLIIGGMLADRMMKRRANGRLVVATVAIFISAPLMFLGLSRPLGDMTGFILFAGLGMASMYFTNVRAIQDVEPLSGAQWRSCHGVMGARWDRWAWVFPEHFRTPRKLRVSPIRFQAPHLAAAGFFTGCMWCPFLGTTRSRALHIEPWRKIGNFKAGCGIDTA
jgi:predicted MFS family arabinose efflux permease